VSDLRMNGAIEGKDGRDGWKREWLIGVGAKGVEYPTRFFARDYAGNRLEFSL